VFDDAHAAEDYVAEAWALSVGREMIQYEQLVDALGDSVEPSFVARMMAPAGPAADGREVRLIPIGAVARHAEDIDRVLAGLHGDPSYRFRMVRARIRPGQADRLDQRFMPGAREHDHIPGVKAARQDLLLHGAGRYRLAWHSPVASARPAGVRLACTGSGSWMRQAGTGSVSGPGQVASPRCR